VARRTVVEDGDDDARAGDVLGPDGNHVQVQLGRQRRRTRVELYIASRTGH